jgi:hypothetical protein
MENGLKKVKLDDMLSSYKLNSVIDFPTRIGKNTSTIIDNIFIDALQFIDYDIFTANLHIWRLFLHPQPEDAPCRGDRDPT